MLLYYIAVDLIDFLFGRTVPCLVFTSTCCFYTNKMSKIKKYVLHTMVYLYCITISCNSNSRDMLFWAGLVVVGAGFWFWSWLIDWLIVICNFWVICKEDNRESLAGKNSSSICLGDVLSRRICWCRFFCTVRYSSTYPSDQSSYNKTVSVFLHTFILMVMYDRVYRIVDPQAWSYFGAPKILFREKEWRHWDITNASTDPLARKIKI